MRPYGASAAVTLEIIPTRQHKAHQTHRNENEFETEKDIDEARKHKDNPEDGILCSKGYQRWVRKLIDSFRHG